MSAGYLVLAGAFGAVLITTGSDDTAGTTDTAVTLPPAVQTTFDQAWETTTTTTTTTTTRRTSTSPPPELDGYRRVTTAAGMTTMIPATWPVVPCTSGNGCEQATDPNDSERFLRIGGSPSPGTPLDAAQRDYERQFAKRSGYQQIRFETGTYHGYSSVEWEFEWNSSGVQRHVRAMYWRAGGNDNIAYASSTAATWSQTLPLYQTMIAYSTP